MYKKLYKFRTTGRHFLARQVNLKSVEKLSERFSLLNSLKTNMYQMVLENNCLDRRGVVTKEKQPTDYSNQPPCSRPIEFFKSCYDIKVKRVYVLNFFERISVAHSS